MCKVQSVHITWSENTPPSAKVALLPKLDAESARGLVQGATVMSAQSCMAVVDASNPLPSWPCTCILTIHSPPPKEIESLDLGGKPHTY